MKRIKLILALVAGAAALLAPAARPCTTFYIYTGEETETRE